MELLRDIMREWYLLLSQLGAAASIPAKEMADSVQLPLVSVFLLGFVGGISPCQITTNLSALAYVSRGVNQRRVWREAIAYTVAKCLVYTLLGSGVIFLGLSLNEEAFPVLLWVRKAIGPLLLLIGLSLIGLIRLRGAIEHGQLEALRSWLPQSGIAGAFSLGLLFSFAFCPSLSWIFFGLMVPLALVSSAGWAYPAAFAVGTAVPLIVVSGILAARREARAAHSEPLMRLQARVNRLAGAVFIIAGLHDTTVYWFL
jgi:sulfite exporter TauE/SafE